MTRTKAQKQRRRVQRAATQRRALNAGRNNPSSGVPAAATAPTVMAAAGKRRVRRRRNGPGPMVGNGGRISLQRDELLIQVVTTAKKTESVKGVELKPSAALMPFLNRLSSCYQRIRWLALHIMWKPAVGTNTNGIISYGVAFNNQQIQTRAGVLSLTPCCDHAVWQGTGVPLTVPQDMLMSRKWYVLNATGEGKFDESIGTFYFGFTHDAADAAQSRGEFWVRYHVEMEGTNEA